MSTANSFEPADTHHQTSSRGVALITGAGKRLGQAIALEMARRGWDILVHYRHSQQEAEATVAAIIALGRRACALQADLSQADQAQSLIPRAVAAMGSVQCLVNSASLFEFDSAQTLSAANIDKHMQTNLTAPILLTQALHTATPEGQQAVVINLLDQKLFNLNPDFLSYTLSKAALHSATMMLAQALAPKLRVVAVAPGITLISGEQSAEDFKKSHQMTPLGYSSRPQDIADSVCYLAQAAAITGTCLIVDGGQHLIPLQHDVAFIPK